MIEPFEQPIDASTRICAVYGHPVKHSASPAMQNAAIARLGLNWRYLALNVHSEQVRAALEGAKMMKFIGVNLTVPHKLLALESMDYLDESAASYGSVNTVRFEARDSQNEWRPLAEFTDPPSDIRAHGFNTDADAIARAVHEDLGVNLVGSKVLLLGAGGAGRTAALKMASEGVAELHLINRTVDKAASLAREIAQRFARVDVSLEYPRGKVDMIMNATSLGLKNGDPLPFDQNEFKLEQATTAYDMIYRPPMTPFLAHAKAAGCRTGNGLGMLLYQGAKALEIWTGRPAPLDVMRQALEKNVYG